MRTEDAERLSEQMDIVYRYLQKVAPWSESNDMLWCDEVICGIDCLDQDRAYLRSALNAVAVPPSLNEMNENQLRDWIVMTAEQARLAAGYSP